jgi:universal stress protein E
MPSFRRILVAVKDLSARSNPAVLKAAQLARACGAEIELFHGLTTPVYADLYAMTGTKGLAGVEANIRQNAIRRLDRMADRLRQHSLKVSVAAEWDYPGFEAIIRRALRVKADLIVVTRHAGRHTTPWLLRLTDWELVRLSPVPVLLVKNPHPYRHPAVLVAVDPTHAFAKPLRLDNDLLGYGQYLSERTRGTLHAVHAYARVPLAAIQREGMSPEVLQDIEREALRSAQVSFKDILADVSISPARRYLIGQHPVDAIASAARKSRSAIVVMGAISRSGFKNLLIGNTAERILDELKCDILVVKPSTFPNRVRRSMRGPRLLLSSAMGSLGYY